MIKAIIFDFDGTVADTLPICFYSFNKVFKEFDRINLSDTEIVKMFGPSEVGIILNNLKSDRKNEAVEKYYEHYTYAHSEHLKESKEILQLLNYLKEQNYLLAIVTGKSFRSLELSLNYLNLNHIFDYIVTADDVTKPKPDNEGIIKVLDKFNISEDEAIFVGDSDADVLAGKKTNMLTVGVKWLTYSQAKTFTVKPDYYIENTRDFLKLL